MPCIHIGNDRNPLINIIQDLAQAAAARVNEDQPFLIHPASVKGIQVLGHLPRLFHRRLDIADRASVNPVPYNMLVAVRYESHLSVSHVHGRAKASGAPQIMASAVSMEHHARICLGRCCKADIQGTCELIGKCPWR